MSTPPVTHCTKLVGKPLKHSIKRKVDKLVASAGLIMHALPAANDAATVQHINKMGKLNGMMCTLTP